MIRRCTRVMNTTVVLKLAEQSDFELFSLVVVYLRGETKTHDEIIKQLPGSSFPRFVSCCICLCILGEMVNNDKYVFLTSLTPVQVYIINENHLKWCSGFNALYRCSGYSVRLLPLDTTAYTGDKVLHFLPHPWPEEALSCKIHHSIYT